MLPLLILVMLLSWVFWAAYQNPGLPIPRTPKLALIIGGCALAIYFGLFMNVFVGIAVLAAAILPLLYLESRAATAIKKASVRKSSLKAAYAEMSLHHGSGAINCIAISGQHAGNEIRNLPQSQLVELMSECEVNDQNSFALIECYLARIRRDPWHETRIAVGADFSKKNGGAAMSREQAIELLGLDAKFKESNVIRTYDTLTKKFRPDYDGFDFLMSNFDRAKEVLLREPNPKGHTAF